MGRQASTARRDADASEKVTINLGFVDLGQIDLLVEASFYASRSDFIRTAARNQLGQHRDYLTDAMQRRPVVIGLHRLSRSMLEAAVSSGERLQLRVLGLLTIDDDVSPELAERAIGSLRVLGALHAPAAVRAALIDRMHD